MVAVDAVLVDFDGTACLHDVAEHLLMEFGDPSWPEYDQAWERGEIDGRRAISAQAAMLRTSTETMLEHALEHCPIDTTFPPFARWLEAEGVTVAVASDGFGFYVRPILEAAGLGHVTVITNEWVPGDGAPPTLRFTNAHPECVGCGTCKMLAATRHRELRGTVAFVGDGPSDRYGALYSDLVFAKRDLVRYCERDGVPFLPWNDFDDVRAALDPVAKLPGPVSPSRCPGWRLP
jgi:2,3-diketo-5-methylthio-1-phosphopentane phosphatase